MLTAENVMTSKLSVCLREACSSQMTLLTSRSGWQESVAKIYNIQQQKVLCLTKIITSLLISMHCDNFQLPNIKSFPL